MYWSGLEAKEGKRREEESDHHRTKIAICKACENKTAHK